MKIKNGPGILRRISCLITACSLGLLLPERVTADTITVNYSSSGWIRNTGQSNGAGPNYNVGKGATGVERNHFSFDLSGITGQITGASLVLNTHFVGGAGTVTFYDVSTPLSVLTSVQSNNVAEYDDLGSGNVYGSQAYLLSDAHTIKTIALSSAFLADANAAEGGFISIGGSDSNTNQNIFGSSGGGATDAQLVLTIASVPLPSAAWPVMALLGGLGALHALGGGQGRRLQHTGRR